MTRKIKAGDRLVIASHNPGKLDEIRDLLAPHDITTVSAKELGLPEPEETGTTFVENAEIKARAAADAAGLVALADDSGVEVEALDGAPGVYSADWGGPEKDFSIAMRRIHDEVMARERWSDDGPVANFNATLALAWPDGEIAFFEGKVFGRLVWPPRGDQGFGYDPMFVPDGHTRTFGEMSRLEKSGNHFAHGEGLSHRARALRVFMNACIDGYSES